MLSVIVRTRARFAALMLALLGPCIGAAAGQPPAPASDRGAAGDPMLGMLIILGAIGFFILLAWIFSRMGDDGGHGPDRTLL